MTKPAGNAPTSARTLGDLLASVFERRGAVQGREEARDIAALCDALMTSQGEGTSLELAQAVFEAYAQLDGRGRRAFFTLLAEHYDIAPDAVSAAADRYAETRAAADLGALMRAAEPRRQALFRKLNQRPGGTAELVAMRADLLKEMGDDPLVKRIDLDLRHLFASWFNRGFLVLRRINWGSPAVVLEKIIAYEAVHAINDWDDLRRRVEPPDRRCFAYFHPCMPEDPLIFVEVALTKGTPTSIASVLAEEREALPAAQIDTAVFYSISNCQRGLRGISFGNALIKQVVADLAAELPGLSTFVTLSPIPGLARWLGPETRAELDTNKASLAGLAATYLATAKAEDGAPLDPVARFHLGNGARLETVHMDADLSENGVRQSLGAMVSYLYDLRHVAARAEAFDEAGEIAISRRVEQLLRSRRQA